LLGLCSVRELIEAWYLAAEIRLGLPAPRQGNSAVGSFPLLRAGSEIFGQPEMPHFGDLGESARRPHPLFGGAASIEPLV
jgi:hypothetical protein